MLVLPNAALEHVVEPRLRNFGSSRHALRGRKRSVVPAARQNFEHDVEPAEALLEFLRFKLSGKPERLAPAGTGQLVAPASDAGPGRYQLAIGQLPPRRFANVFRGEIVMDDLVPVDGPFAEPVEKKRKRL
jgi:hypothetical protein